jgi:cell division protein FtsQ
MLRGDSSSPAEQSSNRAHDVAHGQNMRSRSGSSRFGRTVHGRGPGNRGSGNSGGRFVDARRLEPQESPLTQAVEQQRFEQNHPDGTAAQIVQRQADKRRDRRRRGRIAVLIGLIALLLAALAVILYAPAFRVTSSSITITGTNKWVDTAKVRQIADSAVGSSIARVRTDSLEKQITALDAVGSAKVTRSLPNKVSVRLVPLVPRALLHDGKNRYALVDGDGKVISRPSSAVSGVPLIEVQDATAGTDKPILRQTLAVLSAMPSKLEKKMTKVSSATRDSVTTVTSDGYTVIWGDSQDMRLKSAIAEHLIGSSQMGANRTIDVSSPERPVIKK